MPRTNIHFLDGDDSPIEVEPLKGLPRLTITIGDLTLYVSDDAAYRLEAALCQHRIRQTYRQPLGDALPIPAEAATASEELSASGRYPAGYRYSAPQGGVVDPDEMLAAIVADFEPRGVNDIGDIL